MTLHEEHYGVNSSDQQQVPVNSNKGTRHNLENVRFRTSICCQQRMGAKLCLVSKNTRTKHALVTSTTPHDLRPVVDSRVSCFDFSTWVCSIYEDERISGSIDFVKWLGRAFLRHHGVRNSVLFQARDGSCTSVNFEVTDSTRAILSVRKGADSGSMTVFKPYGGGKDHVTIQKNMNILDKIKCFHIVYERVVFLSLM